MNLWILDSSETVTAVLGNESQGACPFFADQYAEDLAGTFTYAFSVPADRAPESLVEDARVLFLDLDGRYRLLKVIGVTDERSEDGALTRQVRCEGLDYELNDAIVRPTSWVSEAPSAVLADIVAGTRWQAGTVELDDVQTLDLKDYVTVREAVRTLAESCGMEYRYRVEFDGAKVAGCYVDMVQRLGSDTGKVIEYRKDVRGIKRTGDASAIKTALIGLGKSNDAGGYLTFATLTDADKPSSQDWIGDDDALARFGIPLSDGSRMHRFGTFRDPDETSATKLLDKTRAKLAEVVEPPFTYEVDAAMLDRLGAQKPWQDGSEYVHERSSLGDTVTVRDMDFSPPLDVSVRVTEVKRSLTDPTGDGPTIGG